MISFLKSCSREDAFWAVRREALETLAKAEQDISTALRAALQDEHSRVRASALRLLGDLRQDRWHSLFKEIYEKDNSYVVQAEAVRALGKLKKGDDKPFLEEVGREESPRDVLRNAANWSLEQIGKSGME